MATALGRLVAANSLGRIPSAIGSALNEASRACLAVAIAAVGLKTSLSERTKVGTRAVALLAVEASFLGVRVLAAQKIL